MMHIAAGEFASRPFSGHVETSSRYGRLEVVQYGDLNNRTTDLAVVKIDPSGLNLHPLALGNSTGVQVGDTVHIGQWETEWGL